MTSPTPTIESAVFNTSCFGLIDGEIDLSIFPSNNQYTYSWSNGPNSEDLENLSAGNYVVTVSYGNGCEVVENFTITEPLEININGAVENVICNGDTNGAINLSVSGGSNVGFQYNWSNGSTTEDLNGIGAGTYQVVITDSNSCSETNSFQVVEPAPISLNGTITEPSTANSTDGAIQLFPNGGMTPYTISWSHGDSSFNPTNLSAGNYTVTLTDDNNCQSIETFNLLGPVGINDIDLITNFTLFPNPTKSSFNVTASFSTTLKGEIELTNLLGQVLNRFSFNNSSLKEEFDVSQLPTGIYLVTLKTEGGQLTKKLVVE